MTDVRRRAERCRRPRSFTPQTNWPRSPPSAAAPEVGGGRLFGPIRDFATPLRAEAWRPSTSSRESTTGAQGPAAQPGSDRLRAPELRKSRPGRSVSDRGRRSAPFAPAAGLGYHRHLREPPMAVYTHLTRRQIHTLAGRFDLGPVTRVRPVGAGTINTIYDLSTSRGRFILRILEGRPLRDARFESALVNHLAARGLPVAALVEGREGPVILLGPRQPVSVFVYLRGKELRPAEVEVVHAEQIGRFLGRMHTALAGFQRTRRNDYSPAPVAGILKICRRATSSRSDLGSEHRAALGDLAQDLARGPLWDRLPGGIIHGDLFTDNARFVGKRLSGVFDFEMAGRGPWAYDLAVAVCEWAFVGAEFQPGRARALLSGYGEERALTQGERRALYPLARFAAARFALTRYHDFEVHRRPDATRLYKDFRHYMARLRTLRALGSAAFREL